PVWRAERQRSARRLASAARERIEETLEPRQVVDTQVSPARSGPVILLIPGAAEAFLRLHGQRYRDFQQLLAHLGEAGNVGPVAPAQSLDDADRELLCVAGQHLEIFGPGPVDRARLLGQRGVVLLELLIELANQPLENGDEFEALAVAAGVRHAAGEIACG